MKIEIGTRVNVQDRFVGVVTEINADKEFSYLIKSDEGFSEWCSETELFDPELDPIS